MVMDIILLQAFGKAEEEHQGVAMGMIGTSESGRLRITAKDTQKLSKSRKHASSRFTLDVMYRSSQLVIRISSHSHLHPHPHPPSPIAVPIPISIAIAIPIPIIFSSC